MTKRIFPSVAAIIVLLLTLAACGGDSGTSATNDRGATANPCTNGNLPASQADQLCRSTPQGRVYLAAQLADRVTVIDVATNQAYTAIPTGQQPHHVAINPTNTELWVTLYGQNYMQVFSLADHREVAKIQLDDRSDDLAFTPDGKLLFVSLGASQILITPTPGGSDTARTATSSVAVIDTFSYKLIKKIPVGNIPHGIRVRPDGKEVYVANTVSNDVSVIDVASQAVVATIPNIGANPFEVAFNSDGSKAYISNFQGRSVAVLDTATHTRSGLWISGQQPAMLYVSPDDKTLYVAATGEGKLIVQDTANKGKVLHRIDTGHQSHGVIQLGDKLFVTNVADNTVTVIDTTTYAVAAQIPVGNAPEGLAYTPYKGAQP